MQKQGHWRIRSQKRPSLEGTEPSESEPKNRAEESCADCRVSRQAARLVSMATYSEVPIPRLRRLRRSPRMVSFGHYLAATSIGTLRCGTVRRDPYWPLVPPARSPQFGRKRALASYLDFPLTGRSGTLCHDQGSTWSKKAMHGMAIIACLQ